MSILRG
jgi:hypothetical protein